MSNGPDFTPKCYLDPVLMKEFMGEQASERKTPETEAAKAIGAILFEQQEQILMSEIVPAAFALQLECQRDEAREELARLKAPVEGEIADVVARLHDASTKCDHQHSLDRKAAALLESLAARNAELFEQVAALTEERDWYSTANERAERAEAELAKVKAHADGARRIIEDYANKHPPWDYNGIMQDPSGAHAWLAAYRASFPKE